MNNVNIKQKKAWNIYFTICHHHQTRSGKIKTKKNTANFDQNTSFFVKTELRHIYKTELVVNHFILFLLVFFSEITNP